MSPDNTITDTKAAKERQHKRLSELVEGTVDAPNEFASYLVSKLRELRENGEVISAQLKQVTEMKAHLEQQLADARVLVDKYIKDLVDWDHPLDTTEKKPESAVHVEKNHASTPPS